MAQKRVKGLLKLVVPSSSSVSTSRSILAKKSLLDGSDAPGGDPAREWGESASVFMSLGKGTGA